MAALAVRSTVSRRALVAMAGIGIGVAAVVLAGPDAPPSLKAGALVLAVSGFALLLHVLHHGASSRDASSSGLAPCSPPCA